MEDELESYMKSKGNEDWTRYEHAKRLLRNLLLSLIPSVVRLAPQKLTQQVSYVRSLPADFGPR